MAPKRKRLKISLFFPLVALTLVVATTVFATTFKGLGLKEVREEKEKQQEALPTPTPVPQAQALFAYFDEQTSLWGYKDETAEIRIPAKYTKVLPFNEKFALVAKKELSVEAYAAIGFDGNEITTFQFSDAKQFSQGFAAVKVGERWGFIDEIGTIIIPTTYENVGNFNEGYAWFEQNGKFGYINAKNVAIVPAEYDKVNDVSEDLAFVGIKDSSGTMKNYLLNFADLTEGGSVRDFDIGKSEGTKFSQGYAAVKLAKDKYNFISEKNTQMLISSYEDARDFSQNLAPVKKDGKWGYINIQGTFEIEPEFQEAKEFSEGWAAVKLGDVWGYIKYIEPAQQIDGAKKYEFVVAARFEKAESIKDGFAIVQINQNSINIIDQKKTTNPTGATVQIYTLPQDQTAEVMKKMGTVTLKQGALNVRKEAKSGSQLIMTVPNGERIEILQEVEAWLEIKYNGITGFASKDLVVVD